MNNDWLEIKNQVFRVVLTPRQMLAYGIADRGYYLVEVRDGGGWTCDSLIAHNKCWVNIIAQHKLDDAKHYRFIDIGYIKNYLRMWDVPEFVLDQAEQYLYLQTCPIETNIPNNNEI